MSGSAKAETGYRWTLARRPPGGLPCDQDFAWSEAQIPSPRDGQMLTRTVYIRAQPLTVVQALHRSLAHTAGHAFQIVYLAKSLRGDAWTSLTVPRGQSAAYNANPDPALEKPPK